LHKEGKFKELGLSNFTAYEVAECVMIRNERGWLRPTIYQGMYNAISERSHAFRVLRSGSNSSKPRCRADHRMSPIRHNVVVYNPIAGGLFSGKLKSKDHLPEDSMSRFGAKSHNGENYRKRYYKDATFEALAMVEKAAEQHKLTMLEIALRWCVHHSALNVGSDGGDGIIIGVSNKGQLESNLKDLEKDPLPDDVVKVLDEAWLHVKAVAPVYWHGELKYGYDTKQALFAKA